MRQNWKKNTAVFMSSQAVSLFGSSVVQYAITWYITLETKSGIYATLSILCGFLPIFLLSPFAGVWADRYNKKHLIMLADGGIAFCTLLVAVAFLTGNGSVWLLFAASVIRAVGTAVQTPCIGAILPEMVPEKHLTRVNGINSVIQSMITIVSPILSALLMQVSSLTYIFFIDVTTAALAIVILLLFLRLESPERGAAGEGANYLRELKEGFRYILSHKYLCSFFFFCAAFFFMAAPVAFLTPLQVVRNYGDEVDRLSAIEIAFTVGMMGGGLLMASWGGLKNRVHSIALGGAIMGLCTVILGMPIPFWLYLAQMVIFGLAITFYSTPSTVMLQEKVEPEFMGRVFGVMTMISTSMMPLGMLVFGPIADLVAIELLLVGTGAVILLLSLAVISNKELVSAGKLPVKSETEK